MIIRSPTQNRRLNPRTNAPEIITAGAQGSGCFALIVAKGGAILFCAVCHYKILPGKADSCSNIKIKDVFIMRGLSREDRHCWYVSAWQNNHITIWYFNDSFA